MNTGPLDAVELALALIRAPRRLARVRKQALPAGMNLVLRAANRDVGVLDHLEAATGARREELIEAAWFFIESVLLEPGADSFRNLGLNPGADVAQIKEGHRSLIRLVHPDRTQDDWTASHAQRINRAWNALRSAEGRALVEAQLLEAQEAESAAGPMDSPAEREEVAVRIDLRPHPFAPRRMPRRRSWLIGTAAVLAVTVVGALVLVSLHWLDAEVDAETATPTASTILPSAEVEASSRANPVVPDSRVVPTPVALRAPDREADSVESTNVADRPSAATAAPKPTEISAPKPTEIAGPKPESAAAPAAPLAVHSVVQPASSTAPKAVEPILASKPSVQIPPADKRGPVRSAEPARIANSGRPKTPDRTVADAASAGAGVVESVPKTRAQVADAPAAQPSEQPRSGADPSGVEAEAKSAVAIARAPAAVPAQLSIRDVDDVLSRFQDTYRRGDLDRLLALFSADARGSRGGIDSIADDYRSFFAASASRNIAFEDLHIFLRGQEGTATAKFIANVQKSNANRPTVVRGRIQFDLRRDGDDVSVSRLLHEEGR